MIQILGLVLLWTGAAAGQQCSKVPGNLMQIDAGSGQVYGVSKDGRVWKNMGQLWQQMPGELSHVTVGPAGLWGVNKANNILKYQDNQWMKIEGSLMQVDAGGNRFVSGANSEKTPFCLNQELTASKSTTVPFTRIPGSLDYYTCGPYGCWGTTSANDVYHRAGVTPTYCQGNQWQKVPGTLSMVETGTNGDVYGVTPAGAVFKRGGITSSNPTGTSWTRINAPGTFKHVTVDNGMAWLLNTNGDIYKCIA